MVVTVVPTTTGSTQRSPRWYSHITGIRWEKSGGQVELGLSTNWKTNKNIHINPWEGSNVSQPCKKNEGNMERKNFMINMVDIADIVE